MCLEGLHHDRLEASACIWGAIDTTVEFSIIVIVYLARNSLKSRFGIGMLCCDKNSREDPDESMLG